MNKSVIGPCAKKQVECRIIFPNGESTWGRNDCLNPQEVCPRLPGEGYKKCIEICEQIGHAEEVALDAASQSTVGAKAVVYGISHVCRNCQETLYGAGITSISIEGYFK